MIFEQHMIACRVAIPVDAPSRLFIMPWGKVPSSKGDFVVDAESETAIRAAVSARGVDIPLDFEHQTVGGEFKSPSGIAPAAGWIKSLDFVPNDGVYANVEWTKAAAGMIAAKEYRYVSPVVFVRKSDRKAVGLHSVALTNDPAIAGMKPIVNSAADAADSFQKGDSMIGIAKALSLADGADEATCVAAINSLRIKADNAGTLRLAVCGAVGLAADARDTDVVAAINKAKAEPSDLKAQYEVLANSHKVIAEKLAGLTSTIDTQSAETRVKAAVDAGKLTPAMIQANSDGKNFYRELAKDGARWSEWENTAPVIAPTSGRVSLANGGGIAGGAAASGGGRDVIIANAAGEFDAESGIATVTSKADFINDALRSNSFALLGDDERKKHG